MHDKTPLRSGALCVPYRGERLPSVCIVLILILSVLALAVGGSLLVAVLVVLVVPVLLVVLAVPSYSQK